MASASSSAPAPAPTSAEKFWACHAFSIDKIGAKFANKETVKSKYFRCGLDPNPVTFEIRLGFGNQQNKETILNANVVNINRDVNYFSMKFKLLDDEGNTLQSLHDPAINTVNPIGYGFGYNDFYDADIITNPDKVVWRLICELEYQGEPQVKSLDFTPSDNMGSDYLQLFRSGDNTDITFLIQGEEIKAHKAVLVARSSYFKTMFNSDMTESASGEVDVSDAEPAAFRAMLEYLYGGSTPNGLDDIAMDLFELADKYGLNDLAKVCESHIIANLNAENVVDGILLADQYGRKQLFEVARAVLKQHMEVVKESAEDRVKLEQHPKLLFQLFSFFASQ